MKIHRITNNQMYRMEMKHVPELVQMLKKKTPSEVKEFLLQLNEVSRKPLLEALPDDLQEQVRIIGGWLNK